MDIEHWISKGRQNLNKIQLPSALADGWKASEKYTPSEGFRKYEKPGRGDYGRTCLVWDCPEGLLLALDCWTVAVECRTYATIEIQLGQVYSCSTLKPQRIQNRSH